MDSLASNAVGSSVVDMEMVEDKLRDEMAANRAKQGLSMVGGKQPARQTKKKYKVVAATGPNAKVRAAKFAQTDARYVASESEMSAVTYELLLAALHYYPSEVGAPTPPPSRTHDELGELVSSALGGIPVRCCSRYTHYTHYTHRHRL
jgi:hypothetical protein